MHRVYATGNMQRQESITRSVYLIAYARLRIGVVSQPFCVDQLNPAGFNVPNALIRKTPTILEWKSRNKYGGGGFVADDIYFQVSQ